MNLPNKLTVLRIIMIPFFVLFMLLPDSVMPVSTSKWIALALFCIASITDFLDGKIARGRNLVTDFGKFMDPLADKLLTASAFICLVAQGRIYAWIVIIIIAREFAITGFRTLAADNGRVIAASYWGKFKTNFQMFAIILLTANFGGHTVHIVEQFLVWIALILTIVSCIDYFAKNIDIIKEGTM